MIADRPLVLIPARSNSTGCLHKNTRLDAGSSLLQRAIFLGVALGAEVWVSTRDETAIAQAHAAGIDIDYRSRALDAPDTPMDAVVTEFVNGCSGDSDWRELILLQPTSPGRTLEDIATTREAIRGQDFWTCGVTVEEVAAHSRPALLRFVDAGGLVPVLEDCPRSRQKARPAYRRNGLAYVTRLKQVRQSGTLEGVHPRAVLTPPTLTIDTEDDWLAWRSVAGLLKPTRILNQRL